MLVLQTRTAVLKYVTILLRSSCSTILAKNYYTTGIHQATFRTLKIEYVFLLHLLCKSTKGVAE